MKRFLSIMCAAVVAAVFLSSLASAQLINWERRNRSKQATPQQATATSRPKVETTRPVQAQLARREEKREAVRQVEPTQQAEDIELAEEESSQDMQLAMATEPRMERNKEALLAELETEVSNRIEQIYDFDTDGVLAGDEITTFLTDVLAAVERKGNFFVSSQMLSRYDENKDGYITEYETDGIREIIE